MIESQLTPAEQHSPGGTGLTSEDKPIKTARTFSRYTVEIGSRDDEGTSDITFNTDLFKSTSNLYSMIKKILRSSPSTPIPSMT